MNITDKLAAFFQRPEKETQHETPGGVCPNCWGKQEYDNVIRKMYRDKQIDVNNDKANYTFIREFVTRYVDGITLIKGANSYECPTCHVKYEKPTS